MATIRIRDPYGNEFEVDAFARPYWENREGHQILDDQPEGEPASQAPAEDPQRSTTPKTSKAASRPASEDKE